MEVRNFAKWNQLDDNQRLNNNQQLPKCNKFISFKANKIVRTSYLQLTFYSTPGEDGWIDLKGFEIFGSIQDDRELQSFHSIPKEFSISDLMEFKFNHNDHFGLFHFLKDCSNKTRNEIFVLSSDESANGFLSQILTEWNNDIWISKDDD
jgi:hypothetical protein